MSSTGTWGPKIVPQDFEKGGRPCSAGGGFCATFQINPEAAKKGAKKRTTGGTSADVFGTGQRSGHTPPVLRPNLAT